MTTTKEPQGENTSEIRVLIVDNDERNLYVMQSWLSGAGYIVETATDGAAALELVTANPPHLVITDILMPVMDGFALCRAMKSDERAKCVPVVFYTATYTEPKDQEFALGLGAQRFCIKPAPREEFLAMLQQVLQEDPAIGGTSEMDLPSDESFLKSYNQTLIRKLESKVKQLEASRAALEHSDRIRSQILDSVGDSFPSPARGAGRWVD